MRVSLNGAHQRATALDLIGSATLDAVGVAHYVP